MRVFTLIFSLSLVIFSCNKDDDTGRRRDLQADRIDVSMKPWVNQDHSYGRLIDIDGNEYATIRFGNYEWMAENLKTSRFCNGDSILHEPEPIEWSKLNSAAWSHFDNNPQFDFAVGKLYNGFSAIDSRNICPCNWRVPTEEDWDILISAYSGTMRAGDFLKSEVTNRSSSDPDWYWQPENFGANNSSGFSSLPGGERSHYGEFNWMGVTGQWWSASEGAGGGLRAYAMVFMVGSTSKGNINRKSGLSVRCVRDIE